MKAAAALGALLWVTFIITLVFFVLAMLHHRRTTAGHTGAVGTEQKSTAIDGPAVEMQQPAHAQQAHQQPHQEPYQQSQSYPVDHQQTYQTGEQQTPYAADTPQQTYAMPEHPSQAYAVPEHQYQHQEPYVAPDQSHTHNQI